MGSRNSSTWAFIYYFLGALAGSWLGNRVAGMLAFQTVLNLLCHNNCWPTVLFTKNFYLFIWEVEGGERERENPSVVWLCKYLLMAPLAEAEVSNQCFNSGFSCREQEHNHFSHHCCFPESTLSRTGVRNKPRHLDMGYICHHCLKHGANTMTPHCIFYFITPFKVTI